MYTDTPATGAAGATSFKISYVGDHGMDYLLRKDVNKMDGIYGKIKVIYEDFHVHEITQDNVILHMNELIDRNKISKIMEDIKKIEENNILLSINNPEKNLHVLSKHLHPMDNNNFKEFLYILLELYLQKRRQEENYFPANETSNETSNETKNEATNETTNETSNESSNESKRKKLTFPYCILSHIDENEIDFNNSVNNVHGQNNKTNDVSIDMKKLTRKNIHNVIKTYYPFLMTETKNVSNMEAAISHGNILNDGFFEDKNEILHREFKTNNNNENKEKRVNSQISVIEVYPSLNCLKAITTSDTYNKLKCVCKNARYTKDEELEKIISQQLSRLRRNNRNTKKKKNCEENRPYDDHFVNSIYSKMGHHNEDSVTLRKKRKREGCEEDSQFEGLTVQNSEEKTVQTLGHVQDPDGGVSPSGNPSSSVLIQGSTLEDIDRMRAKRSRLKRGKKYLHFNLYKENKDICEILTKLKTNLKKKNADISYCGIKDKRGITVQKFSIHKIKKKDIYQMVSNTPIWCNNVYISNLKYKKKRLSLGNLKGNFFKILIRGVNNEEEQNFKTLSNSLKKNGFINYYGHQRFGCKKIKNFEIGICILKKNYKEALLLVIQNVDLDNDKKKTLTEYLNGIDKMQDCTIQRVGNGGQNGEQTCTQKGCTERGDIAVKDLLPDDNITYIVENKEDETFVKRKNYRYAKGFKNNHKASKKEHDVIIPNKIKEILNSISNNSHIEKTILCSLKNSKTYKNAFMSIPKDIFSLFIHSTQSLIFNILLNIRMKKFGFRIVEGDLIEVYNKNGGVSKRANYSSNNCQSWISDECYSATSTDDECSSRSKCSEISEEGEDEEDEVDRHDAHIVLVTKENISMYDIYDVVLPLPGDKSTLIPPNLTDEYKEVLTNFNLSQENFTSEKNFFTASGGYRKVAVKPHNFKSFFIKNHLYENNTIPMIRSDLSKLRDAEGAEQSNWIPTKMSKHPSGGQLYGDILSDEGLLNENDFSQIEEHITFISKDVHHDHLVKEIPNYQDQSSIFLMCSLPKSSYITVALMEVLKS
ncbi:U2 snRNA/tRNA pseudouridine synthase, putative [Plasmodium ovale]|uniref:tRNA pseudouridine synthase D, putative n=2 Tax=Plasmodium ovale TaxID=36330 RepID=A0A1A8WRX1_PLAOA|nr:tRNA pseudouridine synthase D, putative [Plasmodium ovale curtisi]SBT01292.1 tRNA pseudouridine synthase D, putative [Plasmodium ovale curtisi]SCP03980.1 U2 snRNA/tRNA pseudouridine synthase, putative [Plasmodium ovale]